MAVSALTPDVVFSALFQRDTAFFQRIENTCCGFFRVQVVDRTQTEIPGSSNIVCIVIEQTPPDWYKRSQVQLLDRAVGFAQQTQPIHRSIHLSRHGWR